MITSASAAASSIGSTRRPCASAFATLADPVPQPDAHVDAGLLQVERVRVTLGAVADHGDLAAPDDRRVGIAS